ncbi:unnamed protein product [Merluccius merluccius]
MSALSGETEDGKLVRCAAGEVVAGSARPLSSAPSSPEFSLPVTRDRLVAAQRADPTLQRCFRGVRMSNHPCNSSQRKCKNICTSILHWSCPQGKWSKSC